MLNRFRSEPLPEAGETLLAAEPLVEEFAGVRMEGVEAGVEHAVTAGRQREDPRPAGDRRGGGVVEAAVLGGAGHQQQR